MIKHIFDMAMKIIPRNAFQYRKFNGVSTNQFGQRITSYTDWNNGFGVVQPGIISSFGGKNISEKDYKDLGLDFARATVTVWIKGVELKSVNGESSCDQVMFEGKIYNVIQAANWNEYSGWRRCYCQEIVKDPFQ